MVDVQVHIRPLVTDIEPADMNRVSDFVMAGVERGMQSLHKNVMAFDSKTGEPIYKVPFADLEAASLIAHMTVLSPVAQHNLLQTDFAQVEDNENTMEPIIMAPNLED